jgi:hypothetical protein
MKVRVFATTAHIAELLVLNVTGNVPAAKFVTFTMAYSLRSRAGSPTLAVAGIETCERREIEDVIFDGPTCWKYPTSMSPAAVVRKSFDVPVDATLGTVTSNEVAVLAEIVAVTAAKTGEMPTYLAPVT